MLAPLPGLKKKKRITREFSIIDNSNYQDKGNKIGKKKKIMNM